MAKWTKEKLISVLEYTLFPSLNTKELERDSVKDFQLRGISISPFVAELFHENTKLNEYNLKTIIIDDDLIKGVKEWYFSTVYNIKGEDISRENTKCIFKDVENLSVDAKKVLLGLNGDKQIMMFFYSVDLLVLDGDSIYRYLPSNELKETEKEILCSFISNAKESGDINELSFIHNQLKADMYVSKEWAEASMKTLRLISDHEFQEKINLPTEYIPLSVPLDEVIKGRNSIREYSGGALTLQELSTLLYLSYGIRGCISAYCEKEFPLRMAPSAGGLQGIELYMIVNEVECLKKGLYHYNPVDNSIELLEEGNFRRKMVNLCMSQEFINNSSIILTLTCVMNRIMWKYKIRSYRYIHMDAGFLGENIYLVGTALKLGVCAIAGFLDDKINNLFRFNGNDEFVSLLLTVGKPR